MFYGYLYATLPDLSCGVVPEITLAQFDELAGAAMSKNKLAALQSWDDPEMCTPVDVYRKMREFDAFLNLRIAEKRQEKLGITAELPEVDEIHSEVDFALPPAVSADDPLERERIVDQIRWNKIDDLECGHSLDFVALCCYRMRLASLEKFHKRAGAVGSAVFENAVDKISGSFSNV